MAIVERFKQESRYGLSAKKNVAVVKSPESGGCSWGFDCITNFNSLFFYNTPWTARAIMALDGQLLQWRQFFYDKVRHE